MSGPGGGYDMWAAVSGCVCVGGFRGGWLCVWEGTWVSVGVKYLLGGG